MLKREKKSAVINISSAVLHKYMPYWAVYGSTKAYGDYVSRTLSNEYDGTNIDFMSL
jgi:short-subunit dehydrogenase